MRPSELAVAALAGLISLALWSCAASEIDAQSTPSPASARELHLVLPSTASTPPLINCSASAAASSDEETAALCAQSWANQIERFSKSDVRAVMEYDEDGGSRLVTWKSSEIAEIPGLVEWAGEKRRLVGSDGTIGGGQTGRHGNSSSSSSPSSKGERAVFGIDDRFHPAITGPYSKIGRLVHNVGFYCTASLIARNLILTNAHCVLDDSSNWLSISQFTFHLGYDAGSALAQSGIQTAWVSPEFFNLAGCDSNCHYSDSDWAFLRLKKPLGAIWGYFPMVEFGPSNVKKCQFCDSEMQLAGYSGDPACSFGTKLCAHTFCSLLGVEVKNVFCFNTGLGVKCNIGVNYAAHDCDAQGGSSGSALMTYSTNDIYALHAQSIAQGGVFFPVFGDAGADLQFANLAIWTEIFFQTVVDQSTTELENLGNHFYTAIYVSSLPFTDSGSTDGRTDASTAGDGPDVYYYFTPLSTVEASVDTCGSSFDTIIAIYAWNDDVQVFQTNNDNSNQCGPGLQSRLEFTFVGGVEYVIVVDGHSSSSFGSYNVRIVELLTEGNNAANAINVPLPLPYSKIGSTAANSNAISLGAGRDVVFRLSSTSAIKAIISTCGSSFDTVLGVYEDNGQSVGALLASNNNHADCGPQSKLEFAFQAGASFLIVVDGHSPSSFGVYQLDIMMDLTPGPGDTPNIAVDVQLPLPFVATGNTAGATNNVSLGNGGDVFYRAYFLSTAIVVIDSCESSFNTIIGVYEDNGAEVGALLASNNNHQDCGLQSKLIFTFEAETSYLVVLDGWSAASNGDYVLKFRYPGDQTDVAIALPSTVGFRRSGDTQGLGSSMGLGTGPDVIFKYSPPMTLSISLDTCGSSFDTIIGIYASNGNPGNLLASSEGTHACPDGPGRSRVTHTFASGNEYYIVVGGSSANAFGPFVLTMRPTTCGDLPMVALEEENTNTFVADEYLASSSLPMSTSLCIVGTDDSDTITGGILKDIIFGLGGDDVLSGGQGKDTIYAGAGADSAFGGKGRDIIWGQSGRDSLTGGPGRDKLFGGTGKDTLKGSGGKDTLSGDGAKDFIYACNSDVIVFPAPNKVQDNVFYC